MSNIRQLLHMLHQSSIFMVQTCIRLVHKNVSNKFSKKGKHFFASTKESNRCIVLHEYRQYFAQQLLKDIKPLLYIAIITL